MTGELARPHRLAADAAAQRVSMPQLMGVWRRDLLVAADGRRDDRSDVYWLQARTLCGDLRREAPEGLPEALTERLPQGPPEGLPARLQAFAGRTSERDGIFRWDHALASSNRDGPPDEGRLAWDGGQLREDGVHEPYCEIWTRVALPSPGDYAAELHDPDEGRAAYLLSIGPYAFFAQGPSRRAGGAGAPAFSLAGLGRTGAPFTLSTFPHGAIPWNAGAIPGVPEATIRLPDLDADGTAIVRTWSVVALERPYTVPPAC